MKKLLVFLHSFGFDKSNNHAFVTKLAEHYQAEVLVLDAPFPRERERGGYAWYRVLRHPKQHIWDEKLDYSLNYIKKEIEAHLSGRSMQDVILCGRSQGAFVAMYMALSGLVKPGWSSASAVFILMKLPNEV